jgi:putative transposase
MRAYRTLLIRLPSGECDVDYINRLMALTNLAYRGFEIWVPDLPKEVQYQLYSFRNFKGSLAFGAVPKRWFARAWVPLKTLRVYQDGSKKGDPNAPIVLDFKSGVIRLRQVCRNKPRYVVTIPMPRWVVDRVKEGGDVKYAMIGLKDNEPYLALTAEREVEPYTPSDYVLAVDVNSWRYGIAWGLVRGGRLVTWRAEGPNTLLINTLYHQAVDRERMIGKLRRIGYGGSMKASRIRKQTESRRSRIYRITRDKAYFLAGKLVRKAVKYKALLIIDDVTEESRKELLEEKLPSDVIKLLMSNLKRFVHQLETLAQWYGVPYEFRRLYSTVCPVCGSKLVQEDDRVMVCGNCGFRAPRDMVPMYWALR